MRTECPQATVEDPYAAVREHRAAATAVPQEMTRRFYTLMEQSLVRAAVPFQDIRRVITQFREAVQETTCFRFVTDGRDVIEKADIIFANHQGPKTDNVGGVDAPGDVVRGIGGTEGLYAHLLLPENIRYVLKHYLVELGLWDLAAALVRCDRRAIKKAAAQLVMALSFRKTDPIVVYRTTEKPARREQVPARAETEEERKKIRDEWQAPNKHYVKNMREQRERVAREICESANTGKPVMVYPEGTRSNDGKLLGFVSEYFETIITEYLIPRMKQGRDIRIGILVSDVLSAFPDGVGRDVPAYDKPLTLSGTAYNPAAVVTALQERLASNKDRLTQKEIERFGRMMLIDVRSQMAQELAAILAASETMPTREGQQIAGPTARPYPEQTT